MGEMFEVKSLVVVVVVVPSGIMDADERRLCDWEYDSSLLLLRQIISLERAKTSGIVVMFDSVRICLNLLYDHLSQFTVAM
mmetsp:Transcript_27517/g.59137  ORF Transcript_27517/g.59137 Transcript_27517/m.59137 type:complete len:81 (-) Transcript_27517:14-256(-)